MASAVGAIVARVAVGAVVGAVVVGAVVRAMCARVVVQHAWHVVLLRRQRQARSTRMRSSSLEW